MGLTAHRFSCFAICMLVQALGSMSTRFVFPSTKTLAAGRLHSAVDGRTPMPESVGANVENQRPGGYSVDWKRGSVSLLGIELGAGLVRLPPHHPNPHLWAIGWTNQRSGLLPAYQPRALIRPASIHSRGYAAATMGRAPANLDLASCYS